MANQNGQEVIVFGVFPDLTIHNKHVIRNRAPARESDMVQLDFVLSVNFMFVSIVRYAKVAGSIVGSRANPATGKQRPV